MTTFKHPIHQYAFDYPANWLLDPYDIFDPEITNYIQLYNFPLPGSEWRGHGGGLAWEYIKMEFYDSDNAVGLPLEEWVADHHESSSAKVIRTQTSVIHGHQTIEQSLEYPGFGELRVFYIDLGEVILSVNGAHPDSPYFDVTNAIIQSIRLTESPLLTPVR